MACEVRMLSMIRAGEATEWRQGSINVMVQVIENERVKGIDVTIIK